MRGFSEKKQFIKFYTNILKFFWESIFKETFLNILLIFKSFKKIIVFITFLPIIYYIIKIQIVFGFIFLIFYSFLFVIIFYCLKTNFEINCREVPINILYIYQYTIFNLLFFVPRAKAYILFYNFLYIIWNKKHNYNYKNIIIMILISIFIYIIKFSIILLIGYTFMSLYITSDFTIKLFKTMSWNFENKKALLQHILINCCLDNVESVGKADEMNIIIKENEIIFNMKKFLFNFLTKVKNPELFQDAYSQNLNKTEFKNINNHYTFFTSSDKYNDKNISKNLTSSEKINVTTENNEVTKHDCRDSFQPNLKGEDKKNYLTPSYELDKKSAIVTEIREKQLIFKMQKINRYVQASYLEDQNDKIIFSENGKFIEKENSPTVKEYSKEYSLPLNNKFSNLQKFEKINEEYLNTNEGRIEYEAVKKIMRGDFTKFNDKDS